MTSNPRASAAPLDPAQALGYVADSLAPDVSWIPTPGTEHASLLSDLVERYELRGHLVSDAHLAALAIEHGLTLYSVDTDFARFSELSWSDPLR
jgi:uncharacterized protein